MNVNSRLEVLTRIRPFLGNEDRGLCVLSKQNDSTVIRHPHDPSRVKRVDLDGCVWSVDTHTQKPSENSSPEGSQEQLFEQVGHKVLDNAFMGFNSTIMCYGGSACGKTYTVLGNLRDSTSENVGLAGRFVAAILDQADAAQNGNFKTNDQDNVQCTLSMGYVEINRGLVRDLLNRSQSPNEDSTLKVGPHPVRNFPAVLGATEVPIQTYADFITWLSVAVKVRNRASLLHHTKVSQSSSVLTLYLSQTFVGGKTITSEIRLVDLCSIEVAPKGMPMTEVAQIWGGLIHLKKCFTRLRDGKEPKLDGHPLTQLLKEPLLSLQRTFFIFNLSPSHINYNETVKTLTYAQMVCEASRRIAQERSPISEAHRLVHQPAYQAQPTMSSPSVPHGALPNSHRTDNHSHESKTAASSSNAGGAGNNFLAVPGRHPGNKHGSKKRRGSRGEKKKRPSMTSTQQMLLHTPPNSNPNSDNESVGTDSSGWLDATPNVSPITSPRDPEESVKQEAQAATAAHKRAVISEADRFRDIRSGLRQLRLELDKARLEKSELEVSRAQNQSLKQDIWASMLEASNDVDSLLEEVLAHGARAGEGSEMARVSLDVLLQNAGVLTVNESRVEMENVDIRGRQGSTGTLSRQSSARTVGSNGGRGDPLSGVPAETNGDYLETDGTIALAPASGAKEAANKTTEERAEEKVATEKEKKNQVWRGNLLKEMVESEETYTTYLNILVTYYVRPLLWSRDQTRLSVEDHKRLFGNIEAIHSLHQLIVKEQRTLPVLAVLKKNLPFLKIYVDHVSQYDMSLDSLQKLSQNKKFQDYLVEIRASYQTEPFKGLKLPDLLIMPIQRIPRYEMLLANVLKLTAPDHEDYETLDELHKLARSINIQVNEAKRHGENLLQILALDKKIGHTLKHLLKPHRSIVRHGTLVRRKNNKKKPYLFILFNDVLVWYSSTSFRYKDLINLQNSNVYNFAADPLGFVIETENDEGKSESMLLLCQTHREKNDWLQDVTDCIKLSQIRGGADVFIDSVGVGLPNSGSLDGFPNLTTRELTALEQYDQNRKQAKKEVSHNPRLSKYSSVVNVRNAHNFKTSYNNLHASNGGSSAKGPNKNSRVPAYGTSTLPPNALHGLSNNGNNVVPMSVTTSNRRLGATTRELQRQNTLMNNHSGHVGRPRNGSLPVRSQQSMHNLKSNPRKASKSGVPSSPPPPPPPQ